MVIYLGGWSSDMKKKKKENTGDSRSTVCSHVRLWSSLFHCVQCWSPRRGPYNLLSWANNIREVSIGCGSTVPSSLPSCLPPLRSHTGTPRLIQAEGEFTQTSNCSDRRALVCDSRAAVARKGRQAVREAGGSTGKQAEGYTVGETRRRRLGPAQPGLSAHPGGHVSSV